MKRFQIATLTFALLMGLGSMSVAQEGDAPKQDDGEQQGRRQRGNRGGRGMGGFDPERMAKDLGLSEDQIAKMKAMQEEMRETMRKAREEGGGFEGMREAMGKMREKMNEILTPEQRKKMEEMRGQRGERGGRGGRRNPEQDFKRLRDEAIKSLALSEEESAVLVPLLDGVIETRKLLVQEGEKRRKEFLEKVRNTTDEAQLAELLGKYRTDKNADQETLKKAQAKLTEVLTPTQEAKLVALNLLD